MNIIGFVIIVGCAVAGFWVVSFAIDLFRANVADAQTKSSVDEDAKSSVDKETETDNKAERNRTWFEVLGVEPTASLEQIKEAYRAQARRYHPDKVQALGQEFREIAESKMKELNLAYQAAIRTR
jgi:DnaJ-domain-containing protein 1